MSGSTAGIGLAIATLLANEGATVYINGRTKQRVEAAVAQIKQDSIKGEVIGVPIDLSEQSGVDEFTRIVPSLDTLLKNLKKSQTKIGSDYFLLMF